MELRVLRNFQAVANEGSITAAANSLHLTQPSLSRQIQDLEEELGQKLLQRKSHRVDLTAEGMRFCQRAEEIVALADKTLAEFSAPAGPITGDVYIGCGETHVLHLLAEIAQSIQTEHPQVRFHLQSGNSFYVTERLERGLIDFGVLISPYSLEKYDKLVLPEREQWWGPHAQGQSPGPKRGHPPGGPAPRAPAGLQQIARREPNNEFQAWFGPAFSELRIAATFNLVYNASLLVEAGMGYALTIGRRVDASPESPLCFRPWRRSWKRNSA